MKHTALLNCFAQLHRLYYFSGYCPKGNGDQQATQPKMDDGCQREVHARSGKNKR